MYQALYRKYRPKNFNEVIGQKVVVKTLVNAIENNKISHAYIFSGPRGTGKTSIAKIFAKTINCKNLKDAIPCEECTNCINYNNKKEIDIIEIDAASNNGVDEIRNLKNSVNLVPNNSKYKVYIIDEVHMLSTAAFNALLKTLEEPPKFVIFVLATTELYKVPETIVSRCQNFDFHRISMMDINKRLFEICDKENIQIDEEAIKTISLYSNGGLRDAIGLLDQLSSYKSDLITVDDVNNICGLISNEKMFEMINSIININLKNVKSMLNNYNDEVKNLLIIFENLVEEFKNLLIYMNASDYFENEFLSEKYEFYSNKINEEDICLIIDELNSCIKNMKFENNKILLSQLYMIKIISMLKNKKLKINNKQNIDYPEKQSEKELIKIPQKNSNNINKITTNQFNEFKKIRINNTLAQFNRKDLILFKNQINKINDYLSNQKYASTVSVILDGEIKAKGKEYIIFVYNDEKMADYFNNNITIIEQFLLEVFNKKYKVISVDKDEWEIIKKQFNQSIKNGENKYILMKDVDLEIEQKENTVIKNNDIDNTFNEIVKYEEEE